MKSNNYFKILSVSFSVVSILTSSAANRATEEQFKQFNDHDAIIREGITDSKGPFLNQPLPDDFQAQLSQTHHIWEQNRNFFAAFFDEYGDRNESILPPQLERLVSSHTDLLAGCTTWKSNLTGAANSNWGRQFGEDSFIQAQNILTQKQEQAEREHPVQTLINQTLGEATVAPEIRQRVQLQRQETQIIPTVEGFQQHVEEANTRAERRPGYNPALSQWKQKLIGVWRFGRGVAALPFRGLAKAYKCLSITPGDKHIAAKIAIRSIPVVAFTGLTAYKSFAFGAHKIDGEVCQPPIPLSVNLLLLGGILYNSIPLKGKQVLADTTANFIESGDLKQSVADALTNSGASQVRNAVAGVYNTTSSTSTSPVIMQDE